MLLTQNEVAERLRCSVAKVKRLRMTGLLAYLPGRPVMIEEADFEKYKENLKVKALPQVDKKKEIRGGTKLESPSALARRIWLGRQNFQLEKESRRRKANRNP
ncbi:helix-turn-helix domain-containing protein [Mesorhizobium sp. INR15]|uniref:helix-turn-helix domain-containing protein n=1 Tax=Mesorhizobium sp. INR15 TaxID=2654248 RepID=UPI0018969ADD|nr:helix-turn-helix domain-containing protein [Mesorhizobium sp. INR15]QPC90012.1 helix-turn-helix domain-containing protein [Mesorhizobium sp. INR15]